MENGVDSLELSNVTVYFHDVVSEATCPDI